MCEREKRIDVGAAGLERDDGHVGRRAARSPRRGAARRRRPRSRARRPATDSSPSQVAEDVGEADVGCVPEPDAEADAEPLACGEERERVVHARRSERRSRAPPGRKLGGRADERRAQPGRGSKKPDVFGPRIRRPESRARSRRGSPGARHPRRRSRPSRPSGRRRAPTPASRIPRARPAPPGRERRSARGRPARGYRRPARLRAVRRRRRREGSRRRPCPGNEARLPISALPAFPGVAEAPITATERGAKSRPRGRELSLERLATGSTGAPGGRATSSGIDARRPEQLEAVGRAHPVVAAAAADEPEHVGERAELGVDRVVAHVDADDARDHERVRGQLVAAEVDDLDGRGTRTPPATRRPAAGRRARTAPGSRPRPSTRRRRRPNSALVALALSGQLLGDHRDRQLAGVARQFASESLSMPARAPGPTPTVGIRVERERVEERERRQVRRRRPGPIVETHAIGRGATSPFISPLRTRALERGRVEDHAGAKVVRSVPTPSTETSTTSPGGEVARRLHRVADPAGRAGRDQVARRELDHLRDVGDERRDVEDQVADRSPSAAPRRSRSS